ncbi:hypothetical protein B4100_1099 [Heyndrickxia coagulans]|nr:hypothetical protein B4100_1099 [Heyndrickxia coagulans]
MRSDNWGGKYSDWQGLKNLFQKAGDLFPAFFIFYREDSTQIEEIRLIFLLKFSNDCL